jgi:cytochrome c
MHNQQAIDAVVRIVDTLKAQGFSVPKDLDGAVSLAKTVMHYEFSLRSAIRELYNSGDLGAYIDHHSRLIEEQFNKAWREGLRELGLTPDDMTEEEYKRLRELIFEEEGYVLDFADEILIARANNAPIEPLVNRAQTWANRYNSIVNEAKAMAGKDQKLEWVLGKAEHCSSCIKLSGIVKRASVWYKAGIQPQNAPNPHLECQGYNCKCALVPTKKPGTRGRFPKLP